MDYSLYGWPEVFSHHGHTERQAREWSDNISIFAVNKKSSKPLPA